MLDEFIKVATEDSLFCVDYNVGVVSAALKEGDIDLGIWLHGDVVEAGGDWSFEPYNAVRYKDYVIILSAIKKAKRLADKHLAMYAEGVFFVFSRSVFGFR